MMDDLGVNVTENRPHIGMQFDAEKDAYAFYNSYGGSVGFSVRKDFQNKSLKDGLVIYRKYVCCKQGQRVRDKREWQIRKPRAETRTNCQAHMCISLNREISKFVVVKWDDNHNHLLHLAECMHMMPSQQKVTGAQGINIDMAADCELSLKASYELLSTQSGGKESLDFTRQDQKNYLPKRRQRDLRYGEAGSLLKYFQMEAVKNPSLYYGVQLDTDEHITNIFWADPVMIIDYGNFGDVVSFDTTFRMNKKYRPFACFTGFNHFRETVLFGAALLYDETITSFQWLFETFLQAMSEKYPITIFTDQDQAMAKAISIVMPETYHGLCCWHLYQNTLKHLGNIYKDDSHFLARFKECVYGYEEEHELFEAWESLLAEYNLHDNMWMKSTWALREKWGHVYMKRTFTAGMRSTQLSESLNASLRKYLKSDHDIVQFFVHFERVVNDKRYKELDSEYQARQKLPRLKLKRAPMLVQAGKMYTPTIFELFQDEYDIFQCAIATPCDVLDGWHQFVVRLFDEHGEYLVLVKATEEIVNCSCRKFEMEGILCGHALKVLDMMNIKQIPEQYICKRWRRDARQNCRKAPSTMSNEDGGYTDWGRLKSWHEKATKRKKEASQLSHMSKVHGFSHLCTSAYDHSNILSSQASNSVQSVMGTPIDSTHVHSLNDAESIFMNEGYNL